MFPSRSAAESLVLNFFLLTDGNSVSIASKDNGEYQAEILNFLLRGGFDPDDLADIEITGVVKNDLDEGLLLSSTNMGLFFLEKEDGGSEIPGDIFLGAGENGTYSINGELLRRLLSTPGYQQELFEIKK